MTHQEKLSLLLAGLQNAQTEGGLMLSAELVKGDVDLLLVKAEDREEFPIYVTVDDSQILCITYLWKEEEVISARRAELLDAMLTMNVPMPLSAFSKVGNQYLIFGALSTRVPIDEVLEEIDTLSDNTLTAIEELSQFLNKAQA
jgi:uncharacterized protein